MDRDHSDVEGRTIDAFGRTITLIVDKTLDECGQFRVSLMVDGEEPYAGHFTDKSWRDEQ